MTRHSLAFRQLAVLTAVHFMVDMLSGTLPGFLPVLLEKYTLSIEEASRYFRIGEKKLRRLAEENPNANWLIMNGNRLQIKRKQFEKVIDELEVI